MDATDEFVIGGLASALHHFDRLLFPENTIQICISETDGAGSMLRYSPNRLLAQGSGLQELAASEEKEERYLIFSDNFTLRLCSLVELYQLSYVQLYPDYSPPGLEEVIIGAAAHEVRHRFQLHRRPRLMSQKEDVAGVAVIADRLLANQLFFLLGSSQEAQDHERDARIIEAMMVHQFVKDPAGIKNEEFVRILTFEP